MKLLKHTLSHWKTSIGGAVCLMTAGYMIRLAIVCAPQIRILLVLLAVEQLAVACALIFAADAKE